MGCLSHFGLYLGLLENICLNILSYELIKLLMPKRSICFDRYVKIHIFILGNAKFVQKQTFIMSENNSLRTIEGTHMVEVILIFTFVILNFAMDGYSGQRPNPDAWMLLANVNNNRAGIANIMRPFNGFILI